MITSTGQTPATHTHTQHSFSNQFIIEIYLHHLIEWFALTNLITEIDRKAKHSKSVFKIRKSASVFCCIATTTAAALLTQTHAFTDFTGIDHILILKNACNFCSNLCMIYSIIHLHKCNFFSCCYFIFSFG